MECRKRHYAVRHWRLRQVRRLKNLPFVAHRLQKRAAWRLINWLIQRYNWHNTVLDTDVPNVRCLKVVNLTVRNSYGQVRGVSRAGENVKRDHAKGLS